MKSKKNEVAHMGQHKDDKQVNNKSVTNNHVSNKQVASKRGTNSQDYFVGLDIGTNSVGWAVSNEQYELLKTKGKDMWGSRLFEEGQPALARRTNRSTGRRYNRRKFRLTLLEELFDEEIKKVDPYFYLRLHESQAHQEDKSPHNKGQYFLFNDKNYTDKDFHRDYPTFYHLRYELMKRPPKDIRELFLAIHHIVKSRGNFLYEGQSFSGGGNLTSGIIEVLRSAYLELIDDEANMDSVISNMIDILQNAQMSRSDKATQIGLLFNKDKKKMAVALAKVIIGLKGNLVDLFADEDLKLEAKEMQSIQFSGKEYDEQRGDYEQILGNRIEVIDLCKSVYDTLILYKVKPDGKGFSEYKVEQFELHKNQLKKLKDLTNMKEYSAVYHDIFKSFGKKSGNKFNTLNNYPSYINKNPKGNVCSQEDFYKFLKEQLDILPDSDVKSEILKEIELESFLPLQRVTDNGAVPYQVHLDELKTIIKVASTKFPFLTAKDSTGYTTGEKLEKIVEFRVPYFVGPLNPAHQAGKDGFAWVVRKEAGRVTPWNYTDKVDEGASAEAFINNLTNKCTYLVGQDVLPKQSLLYSEFMLLNELNMLRYNGKPLDRETKLLLIEDVFKTQARKVTEKVIKKELRKLGLGDANAEKDLILTGINGEIKTNLKSYHDMVRILGQGFDVIRAEKIIYYVTLFGDAKRILRQRLDSDPQLKGTLNKEQVKAISKLKYKDWGRLSYEFLHTLEGEIESGLRCNIITAMNAYPLTLMEVLSSKYTFMDAVLQFNEAQLGEDYANKDGIISYDVVDELYVSPAVKRSIWQTLRVLDEITKLKGRNPKKIFVEVARTNRAEKKATDSRKKYLTELYSAIKDESHDWKSEIKNRNAGDFQSKRLFLYYQQMGRCMYSGDRIDSVDDIFTDLYEIDHIYPRSLTKDDSFNNLVLVKKEYNVAKENNYPINRDWQKQNISHWKYLLDKKLISETKYLRLTRTEALTDDELAGFINRQLVETNQAIKAVTDLLKRIYPDTDICYVKAENVSDFRRDNEFIKWRSLNSQHHGKDAYLNIVVGHVFHEKFTKSPANFIKEARKRSKYPYNLSRIFYKTLQIRGKTVWNPDTSLETVKRVMAKPSVLVTKRSTEQKGAFYNATLVKASAVTGSRYLP
ncbi:type II CRISPR RNA-guided endonuclease Cas9, partial [uncultured Veillonella sp.]|uniref:type II CRISPR RNA-guided endonuclease Cas9 n=1 Tax=uncultured Veillonella sp. TaxID=159268 RepID=UPI002632597D